VSARPLAVGAVAALDWREALLDAANARELAAAIIDIARVRPGVRRAQLLWELGALGPLPDLAAAPDAAALSLADAALLAGAPRAGTEPCRLAIPLPASTAVLLLDIAPGTDTDALAAGLAAPLRNVDRRLDKSLRVAVLEHEVVRLERSEQVQRALFDISELAGSDLDMGEVLRGIHAIVGDLMYAENFFIALRDPATDTVHFPYFVDVEDPPPAEKVPLQALECSSTWYLLREGKPLRGNEAALVEQVSGPLRTLGTDSHDWLGVPMLREGVVLGAIVVQSYRPGIGFSDADQTLLEFVASHILTTLERKRSTELLERNVALRTQELAEANRGLQQEVAERQRAERLQAALFQIAQLATDDSGEEAFYSRIHAIIGQLLNAENFFIALIADDELAFPYYVDSHGGNRPMRRPLSRGLSEYVLRHRRPLLVDADAAAELERSGEINYRASRGPRSEWWLGVPLFLDDDVIGLVAVQSYDPAVTYGPTDQELLGFVASQVANSLHRRRSAQFQQQAYAQLEERVAERTVELRRQIRERERMQDRLRHEVMHDALTGLPNRGQMHDRIEAALFRLQQDPARRCALLYLDVDRFKVINDSLGHLAGDDFLREVARRLQACVRQPDLVARLSGDEFAILLEDIALDEAGAPATATAVAQRVLDLLTEPLQVGDRRLEPSASIGIAIGDARYRHADELVRDADIALYRAKALGRKRWQLFDDSLQRSKVDVLAMEVELRDAMRLDQLEPYLQPIVRLADGAVVGYEALLRWNHPQRGVLGPAQFLQVAEDSGMIEAIDWRMFKRGFLHAARLPADSYLSINVAPRHLHRADFDVRLLELLERTGLPPSRLLIEVTEGSLLEDPDHVRAILERLQAAGVGVALDDFGTGYSSLSYLHAFPLRVIKIDRTFLAALGKQSNSAAVIAAVLALARALGLDVVAEGIETQEQRDALVGLGCEFGQGYLFGRPAPAASWLPAAATPGPL
jgi:diguanylate cyclase (GGDEF)-like protein